MPPNWGRERKIIFLGINFFLIRSAGSDNRNQSVMSWRCAKAVATGRQLG